MVDRLVLTDSALLNLPQHAAVKQEFPQLAQILKAQQLAVPKPGCRPCKAGARRHAETIRALKSAIYSLSLDSKNRLKAALGAKQISFTHYDGHRILKVVF